MEEDQAPSCPFCDPPPDRVFYRGRLTVGIWDGYPVNPGHALVVTVRHVADWFDATPQERAELVGALDIAKQIILQSHEPDGFNIGVNVGAAAGQTVPHLHVHLIPRYSGDVEDPLGGVRHVVPQRGKYPAAGTSATGRSPAASGVAHGQVRTPTAPIRRLIAGGSDPLLPHLIERMAEAQSVDVAVAFVMPTGLARMRDHFRDLLQRGGHLRLVTGDYLDVTDPAALRQLLDLRETATGRCELRIYEARRAGAAFHPKAYAFFRESTDQRGVAIVGSSNLSESALTHGVEWNYQLVEHDGVADVRRQFDALFSSQYSRELDSDWIDAYERRRRPPQLADRTVRDATAGVDVAVETPEPPPVPHTIQQEALAALRATRAEGNTAGLVVLATGLGKTWLSAFDSTGADFRRVLFVAHREEILDQSLKTYRRIRPTAKLGAYTGKQKVPDANVVFASIQTLSRPTHLERFGRDEFDYIVVDEFHHAHAPTYRRVIDHFDPQFLLGLTATPERTDGGRLLALCQENLVYRCDVPRGIEENLLCPFHYFGVPDDVDYANIPWRNARFDPDALEAAVATQARAQNALDQYRKRAGSRTLAFCVSQRHAEHMREVFRAANVHAAAVHAGTGSDPRAASLDKLSRGDLDVVFAVDMLNEGVDLPAVDTVLMLRPTESRIVWLQQLGRGLRRSPEKPHLTVIDYIGNHRSFLVKPEALLGMLGLSERLGEMLDGLRARNGEFEPKTGSLPNGCQVTYDLKAVDVLAAVAPPTRGSEKLLAWYEQYKDLHGERPTAVEALHEGYDPRAARKEFGSWLRFVRRMGDMSQEQGEAFQAAEGFLDSLETTPMTRSYKMVLLLAMLNEGAVPGTTSLDNLASAFVRLARRSSRLSGDMGVDLSDRAALKESLVKNPINAWIGGNGTGGVSYFEFDGDNLTTRLGKVPADRGEWVRSLAREIADWRLADYLLRTHPSSESAQLKVWQSNDRPILSLDRKRYSKLPTGWTPVLVGAKEYEANFVKIAVNVLRQPGSGKNELTGILREWFGPDAGQPGTRQYVVCEKVDHRYELKPRTADAWQHSCTLWHRYSRDAIPALFNCSYDATRWRQGYVFENNQVFLLVTLGKADLPKDHAYSDHFLSPAQFEWQSQNQMRRGDTRSTRISDHDTLGIPLRLFVRKSKRVGGRTAPFVYCGELTFEEWKRDNPITVRYQLNEAVPEALWDELGVPRG